MSISMKIGWDSDITTDSSDGYDDADLFTFPNNPRVADFEMDTQREIKLAKNSRFHNLIDYGGLTPKTVVLNGSFNGTNKGTNLNTLEKYIYNRDTNGSGLLRFYFSDDRFIYCFGKGMKHTFSGGRTNFIDYVATLFTPIPFIYSDTISTEMWRVTGGGATNLTAAADLGVGEGSFNNAGSAPAHILKWLILNNYASQVLTSIEIGDRVASGGEVQGNKIKWKGVLGVIEATSTAATTTYTATTVVDSTAWNLSTATANMYAVSGNNIGKITAVDDGNDTVTVASWHPSTPTDGVECKIENALEINLFTVLDGVFKILYYTVNGTLTGSREFDGNEPPNIRAGETNQWISVKPPTVLTDIYIKAFWRDAYWL